MSIHSEIDETLRRLGSVEPRSGLERRVNLRLQVPRKSFSLSTIQAISVCALAAGAALSAVALNPGLRNLVLHRHSVTQPVAGAPRIVVPAGGGFGTASAVHVPLEPVPVQPTPVNQGRGRSRSGRGVLPNGNQSPLPRGVAAPHIPLPTAGVSSATDRTH
jgi:hypothetical protein